MNTPFQKFVDLAAKVLDAVNLEEKAVLNAHEGIDFLSEKAMRFGTYPVYCRVQFIKHPSFATSLELSFSCPIDFNCDGYDELFTKWTKNVDEFLASDSMLLLDNQIKADLKK